MQNFIQHTMSICFIVNDRANIWYLCWIWMVCAMCSTTLTLLFAYVLARDRNGDADAAAQMHRGGQRADAVFTVASELENVE